MSEQAEMTTREQQSIASGAVQVFLRQKLVP